MLTQLHYGDMSNQAQQNQLELKAIQRQENLVKINWVILVPHPRFPQHQEKLLNSQRQQNRHTKHLNFISSESQSNPQAPQQRE